MTTEITPTKEVLSLVDASKKAIGRGEEGGRGGAVKDLLVVSFT